MLTVVMECRNQERELAHTLSILVSAAVEGVITEVSLLDRGLADDTEEVAQATGCSYHRDVALTDVLAAARTRWLLLLEPGASLANGWAEEVMVYIALNSAPARFTIARHYRRPFLQRILGAGNGLESGLVLQRTEALKLARPSMSLAELAGRPRGQRLLAEIVPARIRRQRQP